MRVVLSLESSVSRSETMDSVLHLPGDDPRTPGRDDQGLTGATFVRAN